MKNKFKIIICLLLIYTLIGCLGDQSTVYYIYYYAGYSSPLDIDKIEEEFLKNNITILDESRIEGDAKNNIPRSDMLYFSLRDPISNGSTPSIFCNLGNNYNDKYYGLTLDLNATKYPPPKHSKDANKYKPILES